MPVTFDNKWFNLLYFILNAILKDPRIRKVNVYGGKSSSKTVSISQLLAKECYVKGASSIAFRKESSTIPTTLKKSFNLAIDSMYLHPAFEKQDRIYKCTNQGGGYSEIPLKGIDTEEKAKGIESYKYVYLDELNHFDPQEYEQFNLSLRGIPGQKIFASWNPVDENSWVKTELVDQYQFEETDKFGTLPGPYSFVKISTCGTCVLIRTTYHDNYWIAGSPCGTYGYRDESLIQEYEELRTKNNNSYKVNVIGEWGKTNFGGEFLKSWRSETHTGLYLYDKEQGLYLWFDENVNPYFPCGFFQPGRDNKSPRLVYVIAAESPNNKVSWMVAEIDRKLRAWSHVGKLVIGGDATSQKDDVKQEKGHDLFKLIMNGLKDWKPIRKVPDSNPSVIMSGQFFNSVLDGDVKGMSFGSDKDCRKAIIDFENTKEDKNGKIDKTTVQHPVSKIRYQPFGHFVDLTRYFLCSVYDQEYLLYQKGGTNAPVVTGRPMPTKNSY